MEKDNIPLPINPYPKHGCLTIFQGHASEGSSVRFHSYGRGTTDNHCIGWRIHYGRFSIGPLFISLNKAKRWCEEKFEISGWERLSYNRFSAIPR